MVFADATSEDGMNTGILCVFVGFPILRNMDLPRREILCVADRLIDRI